LLATFEGQSLRVLDYKATSPSPSHHRSASAPAPVTATPPPTNSTGPSPTMAPVQDVGESEVADLRVIPCLAGNNQTMRIFTFAMSWRGAAYSSIHAVSSVPRRVIGALVMAKISGE